MKAIARMRALRLGECALLVALLWSAAAGASSLLQISDRPRQRCPQLDRPDAKPIRLTSTAAIEIINRYINEGSNPASYDEALAQGLVVLCGGPEREKVFAAVLVALGRRDHTQRAQEIYALFDADPIMRKLVNAKLRGPSRSPIFGSNLEQARQRARRGRR